jgi:hypothetical protein
MQQSYFPEANSSPCSASQEIRCFLWNPKFHYRSQEPAIDPYLEPDEFNPHPQT